jgi:hypothetical protein
MIAGCPVRGDLLVCLYHSYPELLAVFLAVALGFLLVWRRWGAVLIVVLLAGLALLLKRWGVLA